MHGQYKRLILLPILTFLFRSVLHDPKSFNNPMEYDPERYLKDGKLNRDMMDSDSVAFGFGRRSVIQKYQNILRSASYESLPIFLRVCPGRHLSDNTLYSTVSCLLAVYDIKPPVDDQGNIIKLNPDFTNGFLS